jgi:hypothetical protein
MAEEVSITFGGKAVGIGFNPSGNDGVDQIKGTAAEFIDTFCGPHGEQLKNVDGEVIAMRKLALRAAQEAQMWAVKAETYEAN